MSDTVATSRKGEAEDALPPWRTRLAEVVDTMREMSLQTEPQAMVTAYGARMRRTLNSDRSISLSRRNLEHPKVRITRDTTWTEVINPWKEPQRLPMVEGGVLAELIYGDQPRILDGTTIDPKDPAYSRLHEYRTIVALPHYDRGVGLNMVLLLWHAPGGLAPDRLPEAMQLSSLFGRVTSNLVLKTQLEDAYRALDRELAVVGEIQRSLLPHTLPRIPGLSLAASYQTSKSAGGDYYDVFALPDGRWGLLIADVSGHGTPAAVVMAITHAISHSFPGPPTPPAALLTYVNQALATRYTTDSGNFVTAFYAIYDPVTRELTYSSAGHNPPRLRRAAGAIAELDGARSVPLGILPGEQYHQHSLRLERGDSLLLYTDGITEAWSSDGTMFGVERLDELLTRFKPLPSSGTPAEQMIACVLDGLKSFAGPEPAADDRTLIAACLE